MSNLELDRDRKEGGARAGHNVPGPANLHYYNDWDSAAAGI
jgi:hypothetical protein